MNKENKLLLLHLQALYIGSGREEVFLYVEYLGYHGHYFMILHVEKSQQLK